VVTSARLALGSAQWGQPYGIANRSGAPSADEVVRLVATAADAGIRTIDTARSYGRSEEMIGAAVGPDPAWTVITKLLADLPASDAGAEELTRWARASLEQSRQALRRPKLDAVLLHRPEHKTIAGGAVWRELLRQRDRGEIGELGVSVVTPREAEPLLADADVAVLQLPGSLLDQRIARSGLLVRAFDAGKTVFVRSIYLQGVAHLDPEILPERLGAAGQELARSLSQIREWCAARRLKPYEAFLGYGHCLRAAHVLIGCESVAQLDDNLRAWESTRALADEIASVAATIPVLAEETLNPARWPRGP
jgi:aryl-alcohol dehydrogenase-like predicted oxidoreductase